LIGQLSDSSRQFTDKKDLKNLCEVSKLLYLIALPLLYEEIIIKCRNGFMPGSSDTKPWSISSARFNSSRGLDFLKDLHIVSNFHDRLVERCYHHYIDDASTADSDEFSTDEGLSDQGSHHADADLDSGRVTDDHQDINLYDNYGKGFLLFCQKLKDDSLRSFRCDCSRLLW
jgi:hypothetical protein